MGAVGALALFANGVCFVLLYRHRADDLNMRSTWMCSRNDLFANSSVIIAAGLVALTNTLWPDIIVGLAIAALFLHSAWQVISEGMGEWRAGGAESANQSDEGEVATTGDNCCSSSQSTCGSASEEPSR
jgi:Co/Zn/Cd efflux system component